MTTNATVTVAFPSLSQSFRATWTDDGIFEGEAIADAIFFSADPQVQAAWDSGASPDMDILLDANPAARSRLTFDDMAGLVFPTRKLSTLLTPLGSPASR
jgi:hypothetical protein